MSCRHRAAGSLRDERGVVGVEFLLIMGMVVVAFMVMLQFAVKIHAERVAQAAAEEGAAAARRFDGTAADGETRARQYIDRLAKRELTATSVAATRTVDTASVTVTGRAMTLIPFVSLRVSETSRGPVERFVPEQASP